MKNSIQCKSKYMKKIIVLLPNNLGDVIMTLPVLEGLKMKFKDSYISFFVEEGFEGGLIHFPYCDDIISFKRKSVRDLIKTENWVSGVNELKDFLENLKNDNYNLVINLSQIQYVSHLVPLIKGEQVTGQIFLPEGNYAVSGNWSTYLYAIPFARNFNALHTTDIYKRIAGVEDSVQFSGIIIDKEESRKIRSYITGKLQGNNNPIAVFHPGAAYDSKKWPVENYIELGKQVIKDGYTIFVTGAESERNLAEGIKSHLGECCVITSGELSFRESVVLMSFSEFCVTADTAMMHAASALSKKVYALFGPTNPVETGPYSAGNIVFAGRCNQRPCFCFQCKTKLCMRSISPQTVYSFICGKPDSNAACDIYRTTMENGIYKLLPIIQNGIPYYSPVGALITRKSLEVKLKVDVTNPDFQKLSEDSKLVIHLVSEMEKNLQLFLNTKNRVCILQFEASKKKLSNISGIGSFWAAMLNIHLNSVPLLEPFSGIKESIRICESIITQIEDALLS